jgi:hypothetical protein
MVCSFLCSNMEASRQRNNAEHDMKQLKYLLARNVVNTTYSQKNKQNKIFLE